MTCPLYGYSYKGIMAISNKPESCFCNGYIGATSIVGDTQCGYVVVTTLDGFIIGASCSECINSVYIV